MGYEIDPNYSRPACIFDVYEFGFNSYRCKVTQGNLVCVKFDSSHEECFQQVRDIYDFPVNGPSKKKALKRIKARMKVDGLELKIIEEEIKVI